MNYKQKFLQIRTAKFTIHDNNKQLNSKSFARPDSDVGTLLYNEKALPDPYNNIYVDTIYTVNFTSIYKH